MSVSHFGVPKHPGSARAADVALIEVRLEGDATNLVHHAVILNEVKRDLRELRVEQMDQGREILEAIRNGN